MATVGRSRSGSPRGSQPDQPHRAQRRDARGHRARAERSDMKEAAALVSADRDQVTTLDALTEEYLASRVSAPPLRGSRSTSRAGARGLRAPVATAGLTSGRSRSERPMMEIDPSSAPGGADLVKNGSNLSARGVTIASRFAARRSRSPSPTPARRSRESSPGSSSNSPTKPQAPASSLDHAPIARSTAVRSAGRTVRR